MLLTIKQTARELEISDSTIKRRMKKGEIKFAKPMGHIVIFLPGPMTHPTNIVEMKKYDSRTKVK